MSTLLLHCCCAHCAAYTVSHWRSQGHEVTALWYNPNIHPYTEHQSRLAAMKSLMEKENVPLIILPGYEIQDYFRAVAGHEEERCACCFRLRLGKTAEAAKEKGFDAFSTTLLISPHQKHELIRGAGEEAGKTRGVVFAYADLRKRYSDSRHLTKPLDLYRQQWCGCIFSEYERYKGESGQQSAISSQSPTLPKLKADH